MDDAKFIMLGGPSATRAHLPVKQSYRDWETLVVHTREMGLRIALGATPRGPVTHLMTSGARLGVIGLVTDDNLVAAYEVPFHGEPSSSTL